MGAEASGGTPEKYGMCTDTRTYWGRSLSTSLGEITGEKACVIAGALLSLDVSGLGGCGAGSGEHTTHSICALPLGCYGSTGCNSLMAVSLFLDALDPLPQGSMILSTLLLYGVLSRLCLQFLLVLADFPDLPFNHLAPSKKSIPCSFHTSTHTAGFFRGTLPNTYVQSLSGLLDAILSKNHNGDFKDGKMKACSNRTIATVRAKAQLQSPHNSDVLSTQLVSNLCSGVCPALPPSLSLAISHL